MNTFLIHIIQQLKQKKTVAEERKNSRATVSPNKDHQAIPAGSKARISPVNSDFGMPASAAA